ncbi:hypothetical protein Sste5346_005469 [Sporothrix stenoceras]|uniref:BZIP domain-containing protein n=1 Tax=Sporothrix stenoceras TaxID=5173 RepID=A0ABR3Z5G5_9PEZI
MSPETASPVYPDRLIHPLPKRRLRERLSSDAADSIQYPPDQTPGAPLFYYPYSLKQDTAPVERPIFVGQAKPATIAAKPATTASSTTSTPSATATAPNSYDSLAGSPPLSADVKPASFAAAPVGISGPGRGRYAHPPNNSNNAGIISNAIASAERQAPQESIDPASQFQDTDAYPQGSLQFTFTCSSKVPGNLLWSGSEPRTPPSSAYWQQGQQQGRLRGGSNVPSTYAAGSNKPNGSSAGGKPSKSVDGGRSKQQLEKEKEDYKIRRELRKQVRDRRRKQQELNATRGTSDSEADIYICPFCEFENITGHKPRLIYEFEMKERKKRLETERRQRNKEKARNRNRKSRKAAAKAAPTTAGSSTQQDESLPDDQQYDDNPDDTGQGAVDDDDYEDDGEAGEADDRVSELRHGIGDSAHNHNPLSRGREGEGTQPIAAGS